MVIIISCPRVTIDHIEGEIKGMKTSVTKLQNGLNKAEKDVRNQFKATIEVNELYYVLFLFCKL